MGTKSRYAGRVLTGKPVTIVDVYEARKNGYTEGYMFAAKNFFKQMYAAIALELLDAGNEKDDILTFLHNVDSRVSVMFDADDEVQAVFDRIGVRIAVEPDAMNRIEVV